MHRSPNPGAGHALASSDSGYFDDAGARPLTPGTYYMLQQQGPVEVEDTSRPRDEKAGDFV
jgi:hypothetical protein